MTEWCRLVRYWCVSCGEECINHEDSGPVRAEECQRCFALSDLDILEGGGAEGSERRVLAARRDRSTGPLPWSRDGAAVDGSDSE